MRLVSLTRASARNTSQNGVVPFMTLSGRTSTPGWYMSIANQVMPWCLGALGFVRARSIPVSAR